MFVYCGNNPVVRIDISGYGWKGIWEWIVDKYERITNVHAQEQMVNNQILSEQIETVTDAADAMWDTYMRGYNLQQEAQLQNSIALVDGAKWYFYKPEETIDVVLATGGLSSVAYQAGIAAVTGNPVTGVAGAMLVAVWGVYRAIKSALL